jgi:histidine triad (HIT) family protein
LYNHAPDDYDCPFCRLVGGQDIPGWNVAADVFYQAEQVTAFIAPAWWEQSKAHVIIVPNRHIENIYDLTPDIAIHVHELARQVAIALKRVYGCEGTSTRQHNEPAGYQEVFHYHLHVFPRYHGDNLYGEQRRMTTPAERAPYVAKLKAYFAGLADALWDKTFAESQDLLEQLADEAHADYLAGRVEDFDPDEDVP